MNKVFGLGLAGLAALSLASCGEDSTTINTYTRDTSSGTRDGFFTGIDFGEAKADDTVLVDGVVVVSGNGDMINKVKNDTNSIGYIGLSSLSGSGVKALQFEGVDATVANVVSGDYQLTRNFNWVLREDWDSEAAGVDEIAAAYIAYMNTTDGQDIIENKGGIVTTTATNSWNDIKSSHTICDSSDNSSITLKIGGSTSVTGITESLTTSFKSICGNVTVEANHTGSGDAIKGTHGTGGLHIGFASREFKDSELTLVADSDNYTGVMNVDAIVAVVNNSNDYVSNVTADDLKKIYDGTITDWNDLKA